MNFNSLIGRQEITLRQVPAPQKTSYCLARTWPKLAVFSVIKKSKCSQSLLNIEVRLRWELGFIECVTLQLSKKFHCSSTNGAEDAVSIAGCNFCMIYLKSAFPRQCLKPLPLSFIEFFSIIFRYREMPRPKCRSQAPVRFSSLLVGADYLSDAISGIFAIEGRIGGKWLAIRRTCHSG